MVLLILSMYSLLRRVSNFVNGYMGEALVKGIANFVSGYMGEIIVKCTANFINRFFVKRVF